MATRELFTFLLLIAPAALHGQSEAALKEYFEGKTVKVKIAMPGTEDGVGRHPPSRSRRPLPPTSSSPRPRRAPRRR